MQQEINDRQCEKLIDKLKFAVDNNLDKKQYLSNINNQISKVHPLEYHFDTKTVNSAIPQPIQFPTNKTTVTTITPKTEPDGTKKYVLS